MLNSSQEPFDSPALVQASSDGSYTGLSPTLGNGDLAHLYWNNISFDVPSKDDDGVATRRQILQSMSGRAVGGRTLAILGPSGAGKTTLLNALMGRVDTSRGENFSGSVVLNDNPLNHEYRKLMSFVTQDDIIFTHDTPREALTFSYRIRTGAGAEDASERVEYVLHRLGLTKCADTIVGVPGLVQGISGGERKRTNIGVEYIVNPKYILLDEPTTGLDSVTSVRVVELLRQFAHEEKRTVVCTIHQPSSQLISMFDDILLLSKGRVLYHGPTEACPGYLRDNTKHPLPLHHNPADHYMRVLQLEEVDEMLDAWERFCDQPGQGTTNPYLSPPDIIRNGAPKRKAKCTLHDMLTGDARQRNCGWLMQVALLTGRSFRNYLRDPKAAMGRFFQELYFGLFIGLVFLNLQNTQQGVVDRQGMLFLYISNANFNALMPAILVFQPQKAVFLREQASDSYSAAAFGIGKMLAEFPVAMLAPMLSNILVYFLSGLQLKAENYFAVLIASQLVSHTAHGFGLLMSAAFPVMEAALAITPLFMMPLILLGGLVANSERLEPGWVWLEVFSWVRYGYIAAMKTEFTDLPLRASVAERETLRYRRGEEVLLFMGFDDDPYWTQIGALFALLFGIRFLVLLFLMKHGARAKGKGIEKLSLPSFTHN